jgi:hypothetical protein
LTIARFDGTSFEVSTGYCPDLTKEEADTHAQLAQDLGQMYTKLTGKAAIQMNTFTHSVTIVKDEYKHVAHKIREKARMTKIPNNGDPVPKDYYRDSFSCLGVGYLIELENQSKILIDYLRLQST